MAETYNGNDLDRLADLSDRLTAKNISTKTFVGNMVGLAAMQSTGSKIDGNINTDKQTMCLIGDSLIAQDKVDDDQTSCFGMFEWANALSGHKFTLLNNAGIGGENSTQILARVDTEVIEYNPTHCMYICGMNNDATIGSSTDTLISHIIEIYEKLNSAGIYSYVLTNTLKTSDSLKTIQAFYVNNYLANYFKDKPNVVFIDIMRAWIDNTSTTNTAKTNVLRDDKHQSNYGAYLAGKEIAKYFDLETNKSDILPISAYDTYSINTDSLNWIKNPIMLGTGGTKATGISGDLADNISSEITSATAVASKVLRSDGLGYNQKIDITSTADGSIKLYFDAERLDIGAGDDIFAVCEILLDANSDNFLFPMFSLEYNNVAVKRMFFPSYPSNVRFPILVENETKLTLITPIATLDSALSSTFRVGLQVNFVGAGSCIFQIGRVGILKVPTL